MKISIDGGGLCTHPQRRFGNYTFTQNIIGSLLSHDSVNSYFIYSFCNRPEGLNLLKNWNYNCLLPRRLWMKFRIPLEEIFFKKDIFLGLNQAVPLFTKAKIITFSHGLSYYFFPHLYRESYFRLSMQLVPMIERSDYIIVSSARVKEEMREAYPKYKHVQTIPFGIPYDMLTTDKSPKKQPSYRKYFLFVGMNHPIKNIRYLIKAFKKFRSYRQNKEYKLILAGTEFLISRPGENIIVLPSVFRDELKNLYANATAYVTASLYESFNLPVLESLSQKCPVIGLRTAIIPELEPYVAIAESTAGFVELMINADKGLLQPVPLNRLRKQFSWDRYALKLMELY